jgi:hypothetical protein
LGIRSNLIFAGFVLRLREEGNKVSTNSSSLIASMRTVIMSRKHHTTLKLANERGKVVVTLTIRSTMSTKRRLHAVRRCLNHVTPVVK